MSVIRAIKVKETSKEWFKTVTSSLCRIELKPLSIKCVNDVYRGFSANNCTKNERGHSETRVHLQSLEQEMLFNKEWLTFLHNIKDNKYLFPLFLTYLCHESMWPILVDNEHETFKTSSNVKMVFDCNHKETDSRMIFHALQQKINL